VVPDPKPTRRIINPQFVAAIVRDTEAELIGCQLCGALQPLSAHHIIPRSQGGDDVEANVACLCGDGTRGCHGRVEDSPHARHRLRLVMTPAQIAYGVGKVGAERFERRYPSVRPGG
jgi:hypothetical protein